LAESRLGSDMLILGLTSLRVRHGNGRMADDNGRPEHPICHDTNEQ
jgi:hypothetical protein